MLPMVNAETVNVFSWFRQKRQGINPDPAEVVQIPLDAVPTFGQVVYFRLAPGDAPPREGELLRLIRDWLDTYAHDPLREAISEFVESGMLSLFVHERATIPEPPDDLVRAYNPGESEERRFRDSTHAIVVGAPDLITAPRLGLWSVVGAARAIASGLPGGVVVDPEFPRLLPLSDLTHPLPAAGRVRVSDHILVPYSTNDETGLLWVTTKGMARFGLPDLELRDVPPHLLSGLLPLVNAAAQRLVAAAMEYVGAWEGSDAPPFLPIRAQFMLTIADIRLAHTPAEIEPNGPGPLDVAETPLRWEVCDEDGVAFARIAPARGVRGGTGVWLSRVLSDLFGSEPNLALVESDDAEMEVARHEALDTLPLVRERFALGFRSGEVLHIKHGFPADGPNHEYMWVAVTRWSDATIYGNLSSDPQYRHDLRMGQAVSVPEAEVYDWMISHKDGRIEGAFTNRVLESRDGE